MIDTNHDFDEEDEHKKEWRMTSKEVPQVEKERKFQQLFESMAQGVIFQDDKGKIITANPAAGRILGLSQEELLQSSSTDSKWRVIKEDGSELLESDHPSMIALRTGGELRSVTLGVFNPKLGKYSWLSTSSVPMYRPGEVNPYQVCTTFEDITETLELKKNLELALRREREINDWLQRALFPDKLSLSFGPGYIMADKYFAAERDTVLGGDFYDTFTTADGKVGFLIGDAMGKGLATTSFSVMARSTFRSFAFESSSPSEVISRANRVLCQRLKDRKEYEIFTTVFLAILDQETGRVRYSSAGHPPPLAFSCNQIEFLHLGQQPLCIDEDFSYEEHEFVLGPCEKMLLYTDGLLDAKFGSSYFGEDGLMEFVRKYGYLEPEKLLENLAEYLLDRTEGQWTDDTAMMAIERVS